MLYSLILLNLKETLGAGETEERKIDIVDNFLDLGRNLFPGGTAHPSNLHVASPLTTASAKFANWDPRNLNGAYVRPRLFLPYFEECKVASRL